MVDRRKKIMVAIDETEASRYALDLVLKSLKSTISSPLILFHVEPLRTYSYVHTGQGMITPTELIQSVQERQKKLSQALLEKAKDICAKEGIVAETFSESGDPKEVICGAAEKLDVELLVLGSRGLGTLQRAFIGSVSNYCVHHAKCPVLVVKKPS